MNGSYTPKSCYKATFQGSIPSASWKLIWKSWAPPRARFFHWLAHQDRCWTSDRLARRGLQHHDPCLLCCQDPEMMDQLLLRCPFSRQVWQDVITWLRLPCTPPSHESFLLAWWHSAKQIIPQPMFKGFASMALLTPWMIRKHRNSCVFEGTQPSANDLVARIKDEASLWTKAGAAGLHVTIPQTWDVH
uniref:Reverse transcriptase zinc-binding domain-containing protein n=1 Tax=Hordeum vulgare subsp. vulgare TaxID=112509 RepID=A0A8I6Z4Y7_HORVV